MVCLCDTCTKEYNKILGNNIRQFRVRQHMTQSILAKSLSLNNSYLSKCERGVVPIQSELIFMIVRKFDTDPRYFFHNIDTVEYQKCPNYLTTPKFTSDYCNPEEYSGSQIYSLNAFETQNLNYLTISGSLEWKNTSGLLLNEAKEIFKIDTIQKSGYKYLRSMFTKHSCEISKIFNKK